MGICFKPVSSRLVSSPQIQLLPIPDGFILGPRTEEAAVPRGSSHGDGRCPEKAHRNTRCFQRPGLETGKNNWFHPHSTDRSKSQSQAQGQGKYSSPFTGATTESHPGKAYGYQEGQRTEANNSINHTLKGQRTACLAALRKRPEKRDTLRGADLPSREPEEIDLTKRVPGE